MSAITDRLADKTGLGEAIMGALFFGGQHLLIHCLVAAVAAAAEGHAELAISSAGEVSPFKPCFWDPYNLLSG